MVFKIASSLNDEKLAFWDPFVWVPVWVPATTPWSATGLRRSKLPATPYRGSGMGCDRGVLGGLGGVAATPCDTLETAERAATGV